MLLGKVIDAERTTATVVVKAIQTRYKAGFKSTVKTCVDEKHENGLNIKNVRAAFAARLRPRITT